MESKKSKPKHICPENSIQGGWTPVKPSKSSNVDGKDKSLANGWSVPIINSVAEMSSTSPGICLTSTAEGKQLVKDLKSELALAILVPSNITGSGEEVHVLVEDPSGRWQTRRRFMIQLGTSPVTYMEGKPKKAIVSDSVKVILTYGKQHTDPEAWAHVSRNAQE